MKLKAGDKVKFINKNQHNRTVEHYGKINKIYENYILIDLKNYKTCIGTADIVDPRENILQIKKNKCWVNVDKEMLEEGVYNGFTKTLWS